MQLVVSSLATAAASVLLSSTAKDWQVAAAIASLCLITIYVVSIFIYLKRNIYKNVPYHSTRQTQLEQATREVADAKCAIQRAEASADSQALREAELHLAAAQTQQRHLEQGGAASSSWLQQVEQRMSVQPDDGNADETCGPMANNLLHASAHSHATDLQSRSEVELDILCKLTGKIEQDLLGVDGLLTAEVIVNPPRDSKLKLVESDLLGKSGAGGLLNAEVIVNPSIEAELYALGATAGSGTGAGNAQSTQVPDAASDPEDESDPEDTPAEPEKHELDVAGKWSLPEGGYERRFALTFKPWCVPIADLVICCAWCNRWPQVCELSAALLDSGFPSAYSHINESIDTRPVN